MDRLHKNLGKFAVVECLKCGLRYTNPRPTRKAIAAFYPEDYGPYRGEVPSVIELFSTGSTLLQQYKNALKYSILTRYYAYQIQTNPSEELALRQLPEMIQRLVERLAWRLFKKRNPRMPVFCGNGRALDIGCGNGLYLAILKNLGWDVTGFDMEDHVAPILKKTSIPIFTGNLEVLSTLRGTFDLITMWHVLEHLHDPLEDLRTIRKLLSDRGSILIEVPNSDSPAAKLFRSDWYQWDLPRHLSHFTPQSLIQLLKESGFRIKDLIHLRHSTLPLSLKYWIEKRKSLSCLALLTHHMRYCQVLRFFDPIYLFGRSGENILVAAEK